MHKCSRCQKSPEEVKFGVRRSTQLQSLCMLCQNAASKEHYEANKPDYIARARRQTDALRAKVSRLKEVPCTDCAVQYPPWVMQFDHIEDKEFDISRGVQLFGEKRILAEIAKCEVVCANCHAQRTHARLSSSMD